MKLIKLRHGIFLGVLAFIGSYAVAEEENSSTLDMENQDANHKKLDILVLVIEILREKLHENQISADAAWEVFASLVDENRTHELLGFLNIVSEAQKRDGTRRGFRVNKTGPFLRDCFKVFDADRTSIVNGYTYRFDSEDGDSGILLFDFRKAFINASTGELKLVQNDKASSKIETQKNTPLHTDNPQPAKDRNPPTENRESPNNSRAAPHQPPKAQ
jgi:hypothetical protein